MERTIYITSMDKERILEMIDIEKNNGNSKNDFYLNALADELNKAIIVYSKDIPQNIVTMNSLVKIRDLNHDEELIYSIVYPSHANLSKNMLSILAPIGTAIIGYSVGDTIERKVPEGTLKLKIEEIIYQPETYGHFQL